MQKDGIHVKYPYTIDYIIDEQMNGSKTKTVSSSQVLT